MTPFAGASSAATGGAADELVFRTPAIPLLERSGRRQRGAPKIMQMDSGTWSSILSPCCTPRRRENRGALALSLSARLAAEEVCSSRGRCFPKQQKR